MGVLSIIFNVWLLYLIKYHSKFGSNFYRVMLATDALLDLALAVVVLLAQPVRPFWQFAWPDVVGENEWRIQDLRMGGGRERWGGGLKWLKTGPNWPQIAKITLCFLAIFIPYYLF